MQKAIALSQEQAAIEAQGQQQQQQQQQQKEDSGGEEKGEENVKKVETVGLPEDPIVDIVDEDEKEDEDEAEELRRVLELSKSDTSMDMGSMEEGETEDQQMERAIQESLRAQDLDQEDEQQQQQQEEDQQQQQQQHGHFHALDLSPLVGNRGSSSGGAADATSSWEDEQQQKEQQQQQQQQQATSTRSLEKRPLETRYSLKSIVRHHGKLPFAGHYTTDVREDPTPPPSVAPRGPSSLAAKWRRYDDALVRDIEQGEALRSGKTEGYLLFYQVVAPAAATAAALGASAGS
jgi:hypothetical protein